MNALLSEAVRSAPRPYRMPPLPAQPSDPETALACAIESLRLGDAASENRARFLSNLAAVIRQAIARDAGDPAFQAIVLREQEPHVDEHVRLASQLTADRRAIRAAVDAIAHPGKLRAMPEGPERAALSHLHRLTSEGAWTELRAALAPMFPELAQHHALRRLQRAGELLEHEAVQRYQALCEQRGPLAGTDAAAARGRAAARTGNEAERIAIESFRAIVQLLGPGCRVVRSLRVPQGFPGDATKAKDEWDAAILHGEHILLLAEVKASPAAAAPDFTRLHRGLQRLAQADADESYAFPTADGEVRVAGESLRALQPQGRALPEHVVYCSSAAETQVAMLSAAAKAVLLAEPASVAYALHGATGPHEALAPVWEALPTEPRLRSALHQYDTSRAVREAMVRPQDLLERVAALA